MRSKVRWDFSGDKKYDKIPIRVIRRRHRRIVKSFGMKKVRARLKIHDQNGVDVYKSKVFKGWYIPNKTIDFNYRREEN